MPSGKSFNQQLMDKIHQVIKRIRWKDLFYVNNDQDNTQEIYGLKTLKCSPPLKSKKWYRLKKICSIWQIH